MKPTQSPLELLTILALALLSLLPTPRPSVALPQSASLAAAGDVPQPLPEECKGVNPPGKQEPACCAYGYDCDGTRVNGVPVTAEGVGGSKAVITDTAIPVLAQDPPQSPPKRGEARVVEFTWGNPLGIVHRMHTPCES